MSNTEPKKQTSNTERKKIADDEHLFISGITGGGKTYWIETYLAGADNVLKLDTKGEALIKVSQGISPWEQVPNSQLVIVTDFEALKEHNWNRKNKVIYVPDFDEMEEPGFLEIFFRWVYFKFNDPSIPFVMWVDELKDITPNHHYIPRYLKALYTKGRFFKSTVWGASQEPRHLPSVVMSQSTHVIAFDLPRIEDRKKLADDTGTKEFLLPLEKYYFWYFKRGWNKAVKGILGRG